MFNWDEGAPGCQGKSLLVRISPLGWAHILLMSEPRDREGVAVRLA